MKRLRPMIAKKNLIPSHQFGFREEHGTVEQVHRLVNEVQLAFEKKQYCSALFADVSQAFDKTWHEGLIHKLRSHLSSGYSDILESFLKDRTFYIKQGSEQTDLCPVSSGVPQGSVLGPLLYLIYTADLPTPSSVFTATFADDTVILATGDTAEAASQCLQKAITELERWLSDWRIKVNETKSIHMTFALRRGNCPPVRLNNVEVPHSDTAKYLGMHLDRRLTWRPHIWTKRKQLSLKVRSLYWLLNNRSSMTTQNKLLVYKMILKPIWSYGIQLWGTAAKSHTCIMQRFQNKMLRLVLGAPWYVPEFLLHQDLNMPTVEEEIRRHCTSYCARLMVHPNQLAGELAMDTGEERRLKRLRPSDLFNYA
ncbi:hypothetical protein DMENIID0001_002810 [Sergentomyia squamirostris]